MQSAGWIGQRLYLINDYLGIGCSGIGANHDDKTKKNSWVLIKIFSIVW